MTTATAKNCPPPRKVARPLATSLRPLAVLVCAALAGLGAARILDLHQIHHSPGYLYLVTALLAVGIYGSTSGIPIDEMKSNVKTIVLAVTVGVLAKAILIAAVMILVVRDPVYAVLLGVAVAQIDPLSVAALVGTSRMSARAKTVLRAWSSFDDPVTMIVTVYLLSFAGGGSDANPLALAGGFAQNLIFALVVWLAYHAARWTAASPVFATLRTRPGFDQAVTVASIVTLLGVGFFAVTQFYLLGLAIIGLFLRPVPDKLLSRLTGMALLLATAALGMLLLEGVHWLAGIALGVAAYGAQVVLAPVVARRYSKADKTYLRLGQQNGITAITLALLAEPVFPQTVGIVAPAILVINGLHAVCGAAWDRIESRRPVEAPKPAPARQPVEARKVPRTPVFGDALAAAAYVWADMSSPKPASPTGLSRHGS